MLRRIVAFTAMFALASSIAAAPAPADGDPASDVLATQALFVPQDANLTQGEQGAIGAVASSASQNGFPIRVALIASPTDLGSVTELWRRPETYARFLGQELTLVYRGPLLVVMPNGFGVYGPGVPAGALSGAGVSAHGLGSATVDAITRLARAAGHELPALSVGARNARASTDPGPWIAFGAGVLLVAIAWGLSLRVRPPQLRWRPARGE